MKYIRTRVEGSKFWNVGSGFIGSIVGEGGYIHSLEKSRGPGIDSVRITDRFYLGEPQFRGFDIRGVGPRVQRQAYTTDANGKQILVTDRDQIVDDALGGRAYYLVRAELEIPLGSGARELGLRPSVYVQAGSLWGLTKPLPTASFPTITDSAGNVTVLPIQRLLTDSAGASSITTPTRRTARPRGAACDDLFDRLFGGCGRRMFGQRDEHDRVRSGDLAVQGNLLRQQPDAARQHRHRRQLDVAVRSAAYRPRQGARHPEGRRSQAHYLQRRDAVLMKTITKTCAVAIASASVALLAGGASAQTAGIATAQPDAAIFSAKAFETANADRHDYKAQLDQAAAAQNALNTKLRGILDANKDGQISQAEAAAAESNPTIAKQVRDAQAAAQPASKPRRTRDQGAGLCAGTDRRQV